MTIIKVHKCSFPDKKEVNNDDLYRCEECEVLWKRYSSGWYRAGIWDIIKYRHQGYAKDAEAENE